MSASRRCFRSLLILACCAPWMAGVVCDDQAGFVKITPEQGFGDPWNKYCWSIAEFGGRIYVGTLNLEWRPIEWCEIASAVGAVVSMGGELDLWAGLDLWDELEHIIHTDGGEIWCYDPADGTWTKVLDMESINLSTIGFRKLVVYEGALFAGTHNINGGAEVWTSPDGQNWSSSLQLSDDTHSVRGMAVVGDFLYAGTDNPTTGAELWRFDGVEWELVHVFENAIVLSVLTEMDDLLYIGTWNDVPGFELYRYDGDEVELLVGADQHWPTDLGIMAMRPFKTKLFFGSANVNMGFAMYAYDPANGQLEQIGLRGFGWPSNIYAWRLEVHRDRLYMGTWSSGSKGPPWTFNRRFQLWSTDDGYNWVLDIPDGLGTPRDYGVRSLMSTGDRLYLGTANNMFTGSGMSVWVRDDSP